jgi:hypothetical protein
MCQAAEEAIRKFSVDPTGRNVGHSQLGLSFGLLGKHPWAADKVERNPFHRGDHAISGLLGPEPKACSHSAQLYRQPIICIVGRATRSRFAADGRKEA